MKSKLIEFDDSATKESVQLEISGHRSVDEIVLIATAEGKDKALCTLAMSVAKAKEIAQTILLLAQRYDPDI